MSARLDTLRSLVSQDPTNSRVRYMLCMELVNSGALEDAAVEFNALVATDADYCAAYYHGGQTLEKLGRKPEARAMYQNGIDATLRTGDAHARGELQGALSMLG